MAIPSAHDFVGRREPVRRHADDLRLEVFGGLIIGSPRENRGLRRVARRARRVEVVRVLQLISSDEAVELRLVGRAHESRHRRRRLGVQGVASKSAVVRLADDADSNV